MLLIENFIPPTEKIKLLSRIGYDEEEDSWKLTQVKSGSTRKVLNLKLGLRVVLTVRHRQRA